MSRSPVFVFAFLISISTVSPNISYAESSSSKDLKNTSGDASKSIIRSIFDTLDQFSIVASTFYPNETSDETFEAWYAKHPEQDPKKASQGQMKKIPEQSATPVKSENPRAGKGN